VQYTAKYLTVPAEPVDPVQIVGRLRGSLGDSIGSGEEYGGYHGGRFEGEKPYSPLQRTGRIELS
jgi:hypothetical protein